MHIHKREGKLLFLNTKTAGMYIPAVFEVSYNFVLKR